MRGSRQRHDVMVCSQEKGAAHPTFPCRTAQDFQDISYVERSLTGVAKWCLRNRLPISIPFAHSLCICVSVRSEENHPETNIQTCLQAEEWKAAFLYVLGFSFSFHELIL